MAVTTQRSSAVGTSVAERAKGALRRLAADKLEPTPENYAMAYRMESGGARPAAVPAEALVLVQRLAARTMGDDEAVRATNFCKALADGQWSRAEAMLGDTGNDGRPLAQLIERVARGMESGGRQWTLARKKDSLRRVLDGSRADAHRLQLRLGQLVARWESDAPGEAVEIDAAESPRALVVSTAQAPASPTPVLAWDRLLTQLAATLTDALPQAEPAGQTAARQLADVVRCIAVQGATPELVDQLAGQCEGIRRLLQHRHHLVDQLGGLCHELTASLTELAEDDSWAKGQCDAMRVTLEDGITARGVKSVVELLRTTRDRQGQMRLERNRARDALKSLINRMLGELGELGEQTGRFHDNVGRYAGVIEQSESLETLTGVVREMVEESHTVRTLVAQTQQRLKDEHTRATDLTQRVNLLEGELHRLSGEVSTDQLTQVANRRGLLREFEAECHRMQRHGGQLAMGLLDIDNFKRLNDELGHNAGDEALKSLAAVVKKSLRPTDTVARYGGEEFVVLLPQTEVPEGQQILARLQRSLSGGLFMHEHNKVMVTFSAGVTGYRLGERIEDALERADQALFEAKRTGKNRTCVS